MMEKLDRYNPYDVMWASVKYDELLQHLFQNQILVEIGKCGKYIAECNENEVKMYEARREWMIKNKIVDEDGLRRIVLNLFISANK